MIPKLRRSVTTRQFLGHVERARSVWKLTYGPSRGGRRCVKQKIGLERRLWFERHGRPAPGDWEVRTVSRRSKAVQQYILVPKTAPPEGFNPASRPREGRKQIKAMLREALGNRWDGELLGSMTALRPIRVLQHGEFDAAGLGSAVRARGLERLGLAILDNVTEADLANMKAAGFEPVPNTRVTVPSPVGHAQDAPLDAIERFWHLRAIGERWPDGKPHPDGGRGTVVGILDTGIASHAEFSGKTIEYRRFRDDGQPHRDQSPRDLDQHGSHGTHVSAIAAGRNCGVAPSADLCVAAVLTDLTPKGMSGTRTQILNGLNWLVDRAIASGKPMVINASLGGSGYDAYLLEAVRRSLLANVLFVAAIGNDGHETAGPTHGSPGNYGEALAVGATDANGTVCDFSGWGTINGIAKPDVCAPGHLIWSAVGDRFDDKRYGCLSGTSMAAPVVSGIACCLLASQPALRTSAAALRQYLLAHTRPARGPAGRAGAGVIYAP
jgi:hypothetical protein